MHEQNFDIMHFSSKNKSLLVKLIKWKYLLFSLSFMTMKTGSFGLLVGQNRLFEDITLGFG